MSISMERFAAHGQFPTYDPFAHTVARVAMFRTQCHQCGFEPADESPPKICPKCGGRSWERATVPGSLRDNALRDA